MIVIITVFVIIIFVIVIIVILFTRIIIIVITLRRFANLSLYRYYFIMRCVVVSELVVSVYRKLRR